MYIQCTFIENAFNSWLLPSSSWPQPSSSHSHRNWAEWLSIHVYSISIAFQVVFRFKTLCHRKYTSCNEMKISTRVLWTYNKKVIYVILKLFLPNAETQNINGKMTKFHSSEPVEEIQNYIWPQSLWHRLVVSFRIKSVRSSARFKRHSSI